MAQVTSGHNIQKLGESAILGRNLARAFLDLLVASNFVGVAGGKPIGVVVRLIIYTSTLDARKPLRSYKHDVWYLVWTAAANCECLLSASIFK